MSAKGRRAEPQAASRASSASSSSALSPELLADAVADLRSPEKSRRAAAGRRLAELPSADALNDPEALELRLEMVRAHLNEEADEDLQDSLLRLLKQLDAEVFSQLEMLEVIWEGLAGTEPQKQLKSLKLLRQYYKRLSLDDVDKTKIFYKILCQDAFKLMFDTVNDDVRKFAVNFITSVPAESLLSSDTYFSMTFQKYLKNLLKLVHNYCSSWHQILIMFLRLLHDDLHDVNLINSILSIVEQAFKSANLDVRKQAYIFWEELINVISRNRDDLLSSKWIRLLTKPLKTRNSKYEEIVNAKFNIWWKLIKLIGPSIQEDFLLQNVLISFFTTCFGNLDVNFSIVNRHTSNYILCVAEKYPKFLPTMADALFDVLGHSQHGSKGPCAVYLAHCHSEPIVTPVIFGKAMHVIVNVVGECSVLLASKEIPDEKQVNCLWQSLFQLVDSMPEVAVKHEAFVAIGKMVIDLLKLCAQKTNLLKSLIDPILKLIYIERASKSGDSYDKLALTITEYLLQNSTTQRRVLTRVLDNGKVLDLFSESLYCSKSQLNFTVDDVFATWTRLCGILSKIVVMSSGGVQVQLISNLYILPITMIRDGDISLSDQDRCSEVVRVVNSALLHSTIFPDLVLCMLMKLNQMIDKDPKVANAAVLYVKMFAGVARDCITLIDASEIVKCWVTLLLNILSVPTISDTSIDRLEDSLSVFLECYKIRTLHSDVSVLAVKCFEKLLSKHRRLTCLPMLNAFIQSLPQQQKDMEEFSKVVKELRAAEDKVAEVMIKSMVTSCPTPSPSSSKDNKEQRVVGRSRGRKGPAGRRRGRPALKISPQEDEFVVIDGPASKPSVDKLTEHQKEVIKRRRVDIPALYEDLTQSSNTNSLSLMPPKPDEQEQQTAWPARTTRSRVLAEKEIEKEAEKQAKQLDKSERCTRRNRYSLVLPPTPTATRRSKRGESLPSEAPENFNCVVEVRKLMLKKEGAEAPPASENGSEDVFASEPMEVDAPLEEVESSSKRVETPSKQLESPSKRVESPSKRVESPSKQVESPSKRVETPSKQVESPSKQVESPSKRVETPSKQVESPSKRVETPSKQVESPSKRVETPSKQVESPSKQVVETSSKRSAPEEDKGVGGGGRAAQILGMMGVQRSPSSSGKLGALTRDSLTRNGTPTRSRLLTRSDTPTRSGMQLKAGDDGDLHSTRSSKIMGNLESAGKEVLAEPEDKEKDKPNVACMASPKTGILRKRKDDVESSPYKKKRVNFSDPPVSSELEFKVDRSPDSECTISLLDEDLIDMRSILKSADSSTNNGPTEPVDNEALSTQGTVELVDFRLLDDTAPIYPALVGNKLPICDVVNELYLSAFRRQQLLTALVNLFILTVGDLAVQTELKICRLPFPEPKMRSVLSALDKLAAEAAEISETDEVIKAPDTVPLTTDSQASTVILSSEPTATFSEKPASAREASPVKNTENARETPGTPKKLASPIVVLEDICSPKKATNNSLLKPLEDFLLSISQEEVCKPTEDAALSSPEEDIEIVVDDEPEKVNQTPIISMPAQPISAQNSQAAVSGSYANQPQINTPVIIWHYLAPQQQQQQAAQKTSPNEAVKPPTGASSSAPDSNAGLAKVSSKKPLIQVVSKPSTPIISMRSLGTSSVDHTNSCGLKVLVKPVYASQQSKTNNGTGNIRLTRRVFTPGQQPKPSAAPLRVQVVGPGMTKVMESFMQDFPLLRYEYQESMAKSVMETGLIRVHYFSDLSWPTVISAIISHVGLECFVTTMYNVPSFPHKQALHELLRSIGENTLEKTSIFKEMVSFNNEVVVLAIKALCKRGEGRATFNMVVPQVQKMRLVAKSESSVTSSQGNGGGSSEASAQPARILAKQCQARLKAIIERNCIHTLAMWMIKNHFLRVQHLAYSMSWSDVLQNIWAQITLDEFLKILCSFKGLAPSIFSRMLGLTVVNQGDIYMFEDIFGRLEVGCVASMLRHQMLANSLSDRQVNDINTYSVGANPDDIKRATIVQSVMNTIQRESTSSSMSKLILQDINASINLN